MKKENIQIFFDILIIILFTLFLLFPFLNNFLPVLPELEFKENRKLASFPDINWESLSRFPCKFDDYYKDNLSVRTNFVHFFNLIMVKVFNKSPLPEKVILGRQGWLFNGEKYVINSYQNLIPLKEIELKALTRVLQERNKWLNEQGIKYYLLIPPDKHTVYPEYLPGYINKIGQVSRLDQLIAYIGNNTGINIIDLRASFRNLKKKGKYRLYKKTDTHWSWYGAFYAYAKLAEVISSDFPGLKPLKISDYNIKITEEKGGDLAEMLALSNQFRSPQINLVYKNKYQSFLKKEKFWKKDYPEKNFIRKVQSRENFPKAVVFIDSYGYYLVPFLSEHFKDTLYIPNEKFSYRIIKKEKPAIVIREVVERFMHILAEKSLKN